MFEQQKKIVDAMSKNEAKNPSAKDCITYPQYVPERIDENVNRPLGYTENIVIQRRPSDFRHAIWAERASNIHSVALKRSESDWGKVELAIEEYAALTEDQFAERRQKLDQLEASIGLYRNAQDTNKAAESKRNERLRYCDELIRMIQDENNEIDRLSGEFTERSNADYVNDSELKIETAKKKPTGNTNAPAAGGSPSPEKMNEEKNVMFQEDVTMLDISGTGASGRWSKGMIARFFDNWTEPNASVKKTVYEKVTDEEDVPRERRVGTGFVEKKDIVRINRTEKRSDYQYRQQSIDTPLFVSAPKASVTSAPAGEAKVSDIPVFISKPKTADVEQGRLGDCYLLSAMIAVVSQQPEHFLNHMLDCGNTVIVKMYRMSGEAIYVEVDKSVVVDKGWSHNKVFADGALWVEIYEKAYAAAGFIGSEEELTGGKRSYGFIDGGKPGVALQHITGKKSEDIRLDIKDEWGKKIDNVMESFRLDNLPDELARQFQQDQSSPTVECVKIAVHVTFNELLNEVNDVFSKKTFRRHVILKYDERYIKGRITANFQKYFTHIQIDNNIEQLINIAAQNAARILNDELLKYIPGSVGQADKSGREIEIFEDIKSKLDAHHPVVLSTPADIAERLDDSQETGTGRAGEKVSGGLAGPHAYAVVDYSPKEGTASGPVLALKLRNPWGRTGRGYTLGNETGSIDISQWGGERGLFGKKITNGEFWLDMSEVVRYFDLISY